MINSFTKAMLTTPGEHRIILQGELGQIEAILKIPKEINEKYFAIIGHPHSLHGGTMQNKVVTTMAKSFASRGIANLRFNFRGVGLSEGQFDAGIGESKDMLCIAKQYLALNKDANLIFAGFSFGSYVAYLSSIEPHTKLLINIAPAVTHFDYTTVIPATKNWIILQGDIDEIIPYEAVYDFAKLYELDFIKFTNTGHFFHGQLTKLQEILTNIINDKLELC